MVKLVGASVEVSRTLEVPANLSQAYYNQGVFVTVSCTIYEIYDWPQLTCLSKIFWKILMHACMHTAFNMHTMALKSIIQCIASLAIPSFRLKVMIKYDTLKT